MSGERKSIDEIQGAIASFVEGLPQEQKLIFNRIIGKLKDLSLDVDGMIKPTIDNLKMIGRIQNELGSMVDNPLYIERVQALRDVIAQVNETQTKYYEDTFKDFSVPPSIKQIEKITWDNTITQLTGSGVDTNVVNDAVAIVEEHIRDGSSFTDLSEKLKTSILGNDKVDPKLISYSKQVINDTMSSFSRDYHATITRDLDLEWFMYLGSLKGTSRPFCVALVHKKYIHKSELPKIASGNINGVQVSREGLFPGTIGANLVNNCGGYNCSHQLIPIPSSSVPADVKQALGQIDSQGDKIRGY